MGSPGLDFNHIQIIMHFTYILQYNSLSKPLGKLDRVLAKLTLRVVKHRKASNLTILQKVSVFSSYIKGVHTSKCDLRIEWLNCPLLAVVGRSD